MRDDYSGSKTPPLKSLMQVDAGGGMIQPSNISVKVWIADYPIFG
jgi:hypothetical protein